jgi:hypothetical protein
LFFSNADNADLKQQQQFLKYFWPNDWLNTKAEL